MKKTNLLVGALLAAVPLALVILLAAGCETESATQSDVRITPAYATASRGRPSVALSSSGWSRYRWSLGDPSIGHLSASVGDRVVYTATRFPASTNAIDQLAQTITVQADVLVSGTNVNPRAGYSGTARIEHK